MGETIAQHTGLIGALIVALVVIVVVVSSAASRRRRRRSSKPLSVATPQVAQPDVAPVEVTNEDISALSAAVEEAETGSEAERLPALYLSMAQVKLQSSEAPEAVELLRKCILAATISSQKPVHAKARLILGDIAHADGDPTTACEHWQIARAIFHELNDKREHAEAETRMLSNGCPTDWVLTDF